MKNVSMLLTGLSFIGVVATGITSGYAGIKLKEDLAQFDDEVSVSTADILEVVVKDLAIPITCGTATIGCFAAARYVDKKTILGLSAAVASMSPKLYSLDNKGIVTKKPKTNVKADIVIDPDGGLYLEPITDVMIQMTPETFKDAREKTNRNFQLRGGVASLYEFFRMLGVKKKDIKRLGIDWIKYIGWSLEWMDPDGYRWIDMVVGPINETEYGYSYICFTPSLMPICVNPPRVVKDITHCEVEDIEAAGIVDGASDIDGFICDCINDDGCE